MNTQGISDAFCDAEALATAIDRGLAGMSRWMMRSPSTSGGQMPRGCLATRQPCGRVLCRQPGYAAFGTVADDFYAADNIARIPRGARGDGLDACRSRLSGWELTSVLGSAPVTE